MDLKQFDSMLHDTEVKLKRLRSLYEQWFQGTERLAPSVARKDLDRTFEILNRERPRNTAARFKLAQLRARYSTYIIYWQRISRQIEEGTYARDLKRVRQRRKDSRAREEKKKVKEFELDLDSAELFDTGESSSVLDSFGASAPAQTPATPPTRRVFSAFSAVSSGNASYVPPPRDEIPAEDTRPNAVNPFASKGVVASFGKPQNRPPAQTAAKRPTPQEHHRPSGARPKPPPVPPQASTRAPAPAKNDMERLYEDYVSARRRNNQSVDNVRIDKLAASVAKMRSKLGAKHAGKKIDFEVVVQNGRVGLKPKIR